jgi:O-antigen ligase
VQLNRLILASGAVVALVTLAVYQVFRSSYVEVYGVGHSTSWFPLEASLYPIVRARGLTGDPNYFAILLSLALLCGLFSPGALVSQLPALLVVLGGVAISFSLSNAVSLAAVVLAGVFISRGRVSGRAALLLAAAAILAASTGASTPVGEEYASRFRTLAAGSSRQDLLAAILDSVSRGADVWRVLFGQGMKSFRLGFGFASHNTYLDILHDTGVAGLALYVVVIAGLMRAGWRAARVSPVSLPWFLWFLHIVTMQWFFSMLHLPYLWFAAGALLAARHASRPVRPSRSAAAGVSTSGNGLPPRREAAGGWLVKANPESSTEAQILHHHPGR